MPIRTNSELEAGSEPINDQLRW